MPRKQVHGDRSLVKHAASSVLNHSCEEECLVENELRTNGVLHILPSLGAGGADRVAVNLVRDLRSFGIPALLIVLGGKEVVLPERFDQVPTLYCPCNSSPLFGGASLFSWIALIRKASWLRGQIRQRKIRIVHSHLWPAARVAAMAVKSLEVQHVIHCHGQEPWLHTSGRRRLFARLLFSGEKTTYIAVSQAVKDYVVEGLSWIPPEEMFVVYNGVDMLSFGTIDDPHTSSEDTSRPFSCGSAGRFIPRKGHEYLLRASAELIKEGLNMVVTISGDGPLRAQYCDLCKKLGISDRVSLPGVCRNMVPFYRGLDVFVLPSTHDEGLPLVVLEAMASGRPVIATAVAGTGEVVRDGIDGFLIPPRDVAKMGEAIKQLYYHPKLLRKMGESARERVRHEFTSESVARQVLEIYKRALRNL